MSVCGPPPSNGLQNWDPENDGLCTLDAKHRRLAVALGRSIQVDRVRRRSREIGRRCPVEHVV